MQKKPPILLIAIVLGLIALGGTALLLSHKTSPEPVAVAAGPQVSAPVEPTPVPEVRYIANRDIPPRTLLTPDMMRRSAISGPKPFGAISSLADVRGMITNRTISAGDIVTSDAFINPLGRAIPANFAVPSGFRAVAIYVNPQQTAAGLVDVGDRVDVLVTQKLTIDKGPDQFVVGTKDFTAGRTVGTDLLVLAVEQSLNAPVPTPAPVAEEPAKGAAPAADAPGAPAAGAPDAAKLPADAAAPPAGAAPPADNAPPETRPANSGDKPDTGGNIRVILAAPIETASRLVAANDSGTLHVIVRNPLDGDSERGPEVREYPSRTITIAQRKQSNGPVSLGGGSGGGSGPSFPVPNMPDVTVSQSSPPAPMPVPNASSSGADAGNGSLEPKASAEPSNARCHGRARHGKNARSRTETVRFERTKKRPA